MNLIQYITWDVSPFIFKIGNFGVRWYGVLFISGFIFGYWLFSRFYKREGIDQKLLEPLLWALLIGAVIGARLGHVIFYEPDYYLAHPGEILKVWHGGLASHGGAIGILFAVWWYVKKYGKKNGFDYMWIMDRLALAVPFAGMAIRLGNLFNSEIYGWHTTLPWGFLFVRNGETAPCHPTQLYEALSYLLIGLILLTVYYCCNPQRAAAETVAKDVRIAQENGDKKGCGIYRGLLFGIFLVLLFGARFLIEYVKQPQVEGEVGKLINNGQILSLPFIVAGIACIVWSFTARKPLFASKPLFAGKYIF